MLSGFVRLCQGWFADYESGGRTFELFRARQIGLQFQLFGRSGSASTLKLQIYVRAMSDTGIPEGRSPGSLAWAGLPFAGYDGLRGMFKATMPACAAIVICRSR